MLNHLQYLRTAVHDNDVLTTKELSFLKDNAVTSDNSDNETSKPIQFKLHPMKRKQTTKKKSVSQMISRRSTGFSSKMYIHWERLRIRLHQIKRKLRKAFRFEKPYIIIPDGTAKILWDLMCMGFVIFDMISMPLQISFDVDLGNSISKVILAVFLIDIFLNFNTGVYIYGTLSVNRTVIFKHYFKLWFWIDFISTFPYDIVLDDKFLKLFTFLRFIKMLKLIRLAKLKKIVDRIDQIVQLSQAFAALLTFCKLFLFVLFFAHLIGCGFHYLALQEDPEISWLGNIYYEQWQIRYINSLYWGVATMTTVGYGDISPTSPNERLLGVFLLLIACGGFAFTMNSIGAALKKFGEKSGANKLKLSKVNKYMKKANIPESLQNRIRKYLEFVWDKERSMILQDVISNLNHELTTQVRQQVNGKLIGYIEVLCSNFSVIFLQDIISILSEKLYCPQEIIFDEEVHKSFDLYIVLSGEVDIFYKKTDIVVDQKGKNEYFGEISFFSNQKRTASARSLEFSNVFNINQEAFIQLVRQYPTDLQSYFAIRNRLVFEHDYSAINLRCYTCQLDDHVAKDCSQLHFKISASHFLQFLNQRSKLQQSVFVRKDRTDYNARANLKIIVQSSQRRQSILIRKSLYQDKKSKIRFQIEEELNLSDEDDSPFNSAIQANMNKVNSTQKLFKEQLPVNKPLSRLTSHNAFSQSMFSEDENNLDKIVLDRLNQYVLEFQSQLTGKQYWQEFSSISDFDKGIDYDNYYPNGNKSTILQKYKVFRYKHRKLMYTGGTDLNEFVQQQEMGLEELKVYSEYYTYPLDDLEITKYMNKSNNAQNMTYHQKTIYKFNRTKKKQEKHIPQPGQVVIKSLGILRAVNKFKNSLKPRKSSNF